MVFGQSYKVWTTEPDRCGRRYRIDYIPYGGKRRQRTSIYLGMKFPEGGGETGTSNEYVIVRERGGRESKKWAELRCKATQDAQKMADKFNAYSSQLQHREQVEIEFQDVKVARKVKDEHVTFEDKISKYRHFMDAKGKLKLTKFRSLCRSFSNLLGDHKRKRTSSQSSDVTVDKCDVADTFEEDVIIPGLPLYSYEPPTYEQSQLDAALANGYITILDNNDSKSQHFCSSVASSAPDEESECRYNHDVDEVCDVKSAMLQAFVHFYFCHTQGRSVVCDLKGSYECKIFTLTTPVIHSMTQSYGEQDQGLEGMRHVIRNHVCSRLCDHMKDMNTLLTEAIAQEALAKRKQKVYHHQALATRC
ncbi:uncharacterized protein LOC131944270 [Physella acuta]|uniref:uncharacterized protein LOC131944262 n=1 Tax=Physella acuta TaxID=109671 RepID=UPI0027DCB66B|nr:uncharacterized protein LOC131944262 [Physella acuta]XP_059160806.1 uncharacterized protein LOC131944270 [Physella acuta]